jgi:hypothetical protein
MKSWLFVMVTRVHSGRCAVSVVGARVGERNGRLAVTDLHRSKAVAVQTSARGALHAQILTAKANQARLSNVTPFGS